MSVSQYFRYSSRMLSIGGGSGGRPEETAAMMADSDCDIIYGEEMGSVQIGAEWGSFYRVKKRFKI